MNINIAIVEEQLMVKEALIKAINQFEGCHVILDVANGLELQRELEKQVAPDLILLNLQIPMINGFQSLKWLQQNLSSVPVIVLGMHTEEVNIISFLNAGARAFLNKSMGLDELRSAINSIRRTGYYFSNAITHRLFRSIYNQENIKLDCPVLSEKEFHFIDLIKSELTYKEIACKMQMSARSVDKLRSRMFSRFDVKSRVSLAMKTVYSF